MEWNSPQVYKKGVMKAYVDEYDNHAFGILQEDSQNGFDAYAKGTMPKDMKIEFKYDGDNKVFYYRDFGTVGMPHCNECQWGTRPDGVPCTNQDCSWGCYHNLAYSGKTGLSLGSRGMGKSLRMESGEKTVVNTTLPDGRNMASEWQVVDGDWKWRKAPELARKLSISGTEMITYGIRDNVHDQLIESDEVVRFLQEKWFRLIDHGAQIEYILEKGGARSRVFVPKMKYPEIETSEKDKPTILKKGHVVVKSRGRRMGELRNLEIYLASRPFADEDPRLGIAIVKNGKQAITRYSQFPTDIPENLRRRIFGHVDADCEREPFLNDAENSTHTGYQWTHPTYKAVRLELNRIVKDFVQPFIRSGGERVTEKEQQEAREILVVVNAALARIPELQIFGQMGEKPGGSVLEKPKSCPYISSLRPSNERFNRGETIRAKAVIKNPVPKEMMAGLNFSFYDPTPVVIRDGMSWVLLREGTAESPYTLEENWLIDVDDSMVPGIHWIQVGLEDKDGNPMLDEEGKQEKVRASVHIEQDPAVSRRRPRTGAGAAKKSEGERGGEGEGGLADLNWFKKSDMPECEVIIETARAYAFANRFGRRYRFIIDGSSKRQTPWLAVAEGIAEKLIEKKVEQDLEEGGESWTVEEVKAKLKELDSLKSKFVKTFLEELH